MSLTPRAVYSDGTHLDLTEGVRYEDIDRSRLASFCLVRDSERIFNMILQEGQRLIWRKRVILTQGGKQHTWHLVGWQKTVQGENIQCIGYVEEETGTVVMAGEWKGEHVLLGDVQLLDFE